MRGDMMAIDLNYKCTIFGPLRIPYYVLNEDPKNPYKKDEIHMNVNPEPFEIPDERVKKHMEENVKHREEQARKEGKVFYDGPMARLTGAVVKDDLHQIELHMQPTTFFTRVFTNNDLDNDLVWKMVEERGIEYTNLDDGLANPIGNNVLVLTEDGYVILNKRSDKIAQYPSLFGILPAGFTNPDKDGYNPFDTAEREATEELGVEIKEVELLGFGRAGDDRHPEFNFCLLYTSPSPRD